MFHKLISFEYVFVNAWVFWIFLFAIAILFIAYHKGRQHGKKRLPRINMSEISLLYLMQKMLSGKQAPGVLMLQLFQAWVHLFPKEGICCFFQTFQRLILLYKHETVEPILSSSKILKKGYEYHLIKFDSGLLSSNIEQWHIHRRLISPAFNAHVLEDFCHVFNKKAKLFPEEIVTLMAHNQYIEVIDFFSYRVLDMLCETAIGIKDTNSKENLSDYTEATFRLEKIALERIYKPWLWPDFIFDRLKLGKELKRNYDILEKFINETVKEKKMKKLAQIANNSPDGNTGPKKRLAFLDHLLDIHMNDSTFTMTDIADEVKTFMDAGSVTVFTTIGWVLYMLGLYPDVQRKVHEELDQVFGDATSIPITKAHIKELNYLDCVIKETMRLFPPVPYISRMTEEDTVINGYTIPKGTTCGIVIYEIHRDPEIFPKPEMFDPDRFAFHEKRPTYAYIPFSAGPRNCIGQQFAKLEIMIVIATILLRFKVKSKLPVDKLLISANVTLRAQSGLHVSFEARKL